jgi:hypothetical protein
MLDREILRDSHWFDIFLFDFSGLKNYSAAWGAARLSLFVHVDIEEGRCGVGG